MAELARNVRSGDNPDVFDPINRDIGDTEEMTTELLTPRQLVLIRFRKNRLAVIGLFVLILFISILFNIY